MLVFPYKLPQSFYKSFIPTKLYNLILLSVDKVKLAEMDKVLNDRGIKKPILNVIKYALHNMDVIEGGEKCIMVFSNTKKLGNYTVNQLMRILDAGDLEVKGMGAIRRAEEFINSHAGDIREEYLDKYVS